MVLHAVKDGVGNETVFRSGIRGQRIWRRGWRPGPYYNVIRGADHISAFPDIVCENLPEIAFALGFAIRKHTVALAEGAFDVTLPQIKTKAFPVNTGRGKIVQAGRDILILFFGGEQMSAWKQCR